MSISPEDKQLQMALRRHIAKSNLDISMLNINVAKGNVDLTGTVRAPRGNPGGISVRKEMQVLKAQLQQVRGVRDVFMERVRIFD